MSPITANLITATLLLLALAGFLLSSLRPAKSSRDLRFVGVVFLVLGLFALVSRLPRTCWSGGYGQIEYQITFEDGNHQPIAGIELRVEDRQGHIFYHYPVTDYLPGHIPTSDSNGLMMFHHVSDCVEFDGTETFLFNVIPVEERAGPMYICYFLYRGQEVYRLTYRELNSWRKGTWKEGVEKVKLSWKRPEWPWSLFLCDEGESWHAHYARTMKLYDLDGDGKLNPEEGAAYCAAMSLPNENAVIARLKGEDPTEEIEFPVVRRTITIPSKPE
jgi:hypothetical protein